ncbi:MAG: GtrA family protein [Candidatus Heimdallarchaeaceae archaeon]
MWRDFVENNSKDLGKMIKFGLVGGSVTILGALLMYLFIDILNINESVAYFIQTLIALQLNFIFNKIITWSKKSNKLKSLVISWAKFHLVRVVTALINQLLFALLISIKIHYLFAYAITIMVCTVINYLGTDRFVFKQ